MLKRKTTLLILCPYPVGQAPSQRFRFEQYIDLLSGHDIAVTIAPFLDDQTWRILYQPGHGLKKAWGILRGFAQRLLLLFRLRQFDYVLVHREAAPLGPPVLEWWMARVANKKLIYDFDDAIWLPNTSRENRIVGWLKWHQKVSAICRMSYRVSAGNAYLRDYAAQFSADARINPTTIDTENLHHPERFPKTNRRNVIIGWTGTHSTLNYLHDFLPVFRALQQEFGSTISLMVIADRDPQLDVEYQFVRWQKETEIRDLAQFDIGVMPLTDDPWARGKCGFKALQYMALEIPPVISPVGVNSEIVSNECGFLCSSFDEWHQAMRQLISQPALRESMGKKARQRVIDHYSVRSNTAAFLSFFS